MSIASGAPRSTQTPNMLSRDQLVHLFSRFAFLTSLPEVKKRIADAVKDKQEAVAVTTAIQEEILQEMGIDPRFGIACLGKVNAVYENDRDLMIQFYGFVANSRVLSLLLIFLEYILWANLAREEMAIDEAELEPAEFAEKMDHQQKLQEQQLEMLKFIRKFHPDDQSAILGTLHEQMESANFDNCAAFLTTDEIQEIVRRRSTPREPNASC